jgi:hypothetical protein
LQHGFVTTFCEISVLGNLLLLDYIAIFPGLHRDRRSHATYPSSGGRCCLTSVCGVTCSVCLISVCWVTCLVIVCWVTLLLNRGRGCAGHPSSPFAGGASLLRVYGVGVGVWCRVYSVRCRVQDVGCRVPGVRCTVQGVRSRVYGVGCTVYGVRRRCAVYGAWGVGKAV